MDLRRVALGACTHRADDRQAALYGLGDEVHLRAQRVDGVDDVVVAVTVEELDHILILEEGLDDLQLDVGVDGAKACSQDAGFRLADGLGGGYELAIDIRRLHDVGVDDGHTADACAGDELGSEATDTAETDDEDVALGELAHALVTEEEAGTLGPRLGRSLLLGLVHWMPRSLRACW